MEPFDFLGGRIRLDVTLQVHIRAIHQLVGIQRLPKRQRNNGCICNGQGTSQALGDHNSMGKQSGSEVLKIIRTSYVQDT